MVWVVLYLKKYCARNFFPGLVWSCIVLLFSVPNKKISEQHWISGISVIEIQKFKFGNSRCIFGTETGWEVASLEWAGLSQDREEDAPECLGWEISRIFQKKIWDPKNETRNADLYLTIILFYNLDDFSINSFQGCTHFGSLDCKYWLGRRGNNKCYS